MSNNPNAPPLVDQILADRQKTHGDFGEVAVIAQAIKTIIRGHAQLLSPDQREALDIIATKIARILSGDANEPDHWLDIVGYATLALRSIQNEGVDK